MKILFTKSKWEMWDDSLASFLARAKADGFDAVEIFLPALTESPREVRQMVSDHGLLLVAQINTQGEGPGEHLESLKRHFALAAATEPVLVNSHTARDIFSFDDNIEIFRVAIELSRDAGLLFTQETHRRRPLFAATETLKYLRALPELRLNADFSHWFVVHESDLTDQPEAMEHAIERSFHIHARVGFAEGPQVPDPLSPFFKADLDRSVALWRRIIEARRRDGTEWLTITPEFGPPPYMPIEPKEGRPLADAWTVNVALRDHLKTCL